MGLPPLFRDAIGKKQATVTVRLSLISGRTVKIEALADPMDAGLEAVAAFRDGVEAISDVLTPRGELRWQLAFPVPGDVPALCVAWAKACGFGKHGFARLVQIVRHLELVEADLQRFYGVDLGRWPRREISTRRVVSLVSGLEHETASLFWSELVGQNPLTHEAIVLAQLASAPGHPHDFLLTREQRRQMQADAEAIERIKQRGF